MSVEKHLTEMDIMPIEHQRKAVNYAHCFLSDSVVDLKQSIASQYITPYIRTQLERRLKEYEADLKIFEELNDKWTI